MFLHYPPISKEHDATCTAYWSPCNQNKYKEVIDGTFSSPKTGDQVRYSKDDLTGLVEILSVSTDANKDPIKIKFQNGRILHTTQDYLSLVDDLDVRIPVSAKDYLKLVHSLTQQDIQSIVHPAESPTKEDKLFLTWHE